MSRQPWQAQHAVAISLGFIRRHLQEARAARAAMRAATNKRDYERAEEDLAMAMYEIAMLRDTIAAERHFMRTGEEIVPAHLAPTVGEFATDRYYTSHHYHGGRAHKRPLLSALRSR